MNKIIRIEEGMIEHLRLLSKCSDKHEVREHYNAYNINAHNIELIGVEYLGICTPFSHLYGIELGDIINFADWEGYSGDIDFPIPLNGFTNPQTAYTCNGSKRWDGEYGDSRRAFCLWCSDRLELIFKKQKEYDASVTRIIGGWEYMKKKNNELTEQER